MPFEYTVKIVRQQLNTKKSCKEKPYLFEVREPEDFKKLDTDDLSHIYLAAQAIEARIQTMLAERG